MIEMRRAQLSFGDGLIAEEVSDLREHWMKHADAVLADEAIVAAVYEALGKRRGMSLSLLNIEKRSLPWLTLCGFGLASKDAVD
jgi:hypothetical protein